MRIFLILSMGVTVGFYSGCSRVKLSLEGKIADEPKVFSCQEEAKPKSLQFLEQQYRCQSQE